MRRGRPDAVDKLRKMLAFLAAMREERDPRDVPIWKAHRLTDDRRTRAGYYTTSRSTRSDAVAEVL
jgi:hypothetical protein